MAEGWTGGQNAFGGFADGLAHYTDKILFDEVWQREGLSARDRSLITVAALTALGKNEQLTFHLDFAKQNGVTEEELKEAILHMAFYAGWPKWHGRDGRGEEGVRRGGVTPGPGGRNCSSPSGDSCAASGQPDALRVHVRSAAR